MTIKLILSSIVCGACAAQYPLSQRLDEAKEAIEKVKSALKEKGSTEEILPTQDVNDAETDKK